MKGAMNIDQQFNVLREASGVQIGAMLPRFLEQSKDLVGIIEREGMLCEYVSERDHLYITFGRPRAGMALFAASIVIIADPETLEFLGIEVLDFQKEVAGGNLKEWQPIAEFLAWQPIVHIPPTECREPANLPNAIASSVRRELTSV